MHNTSIATDIPPPTLIRSRRRSMSLEIRPDGTLVVRAPHFTGEETIREFVSRKRAWIDKVYRHTCAARSLFKPKQFIEGERLLYLGKEYTLHLTRDMYGKLIFEDRFILNEKYRAKAVRLFERWYRDEAFMVFTLRCKYYAALMDVKYVSINLSGAKQRWGSCCRNGNLRFNWRLIMAPQEIVDYVVVHELAHLVEPNHSSRFWAVVERYFPRHRESRAWLKDNQYRLAF